MSQGENSSSGNGSERGGSASGTGPGSMTLSSVINEIQGLKDKFKNDDEAAVSPFQNLDKATVMQETKIFSDAKMVTRYPRTCCQLITKLLHILTQGEPFTSTETTDVFFGVTKLFQSKDPNLRRMIYLFIKEAAEATAADEVIIVTQSLTKDMNCDVDLYRANAIRVLCRIIDGSMLNAIERYIKQAVVDRNSLVASSALVSGMHLMKQSPDVVRRWVNEVQEAMISPFEMVQYHAVSLLYKIKQHDKLAVTKLVTQLQKQNFSSALAMCLLIRYTSKMLREDITAQSSRSFYQFLESMLRHKNEMVIYEAARAICMLPLEATDLSPAIAVLQLFLSSTKPPLRFAAVRTLNYVAMTQPILVIRCNEDMESLISDANRSIATLAITTLLKTGAESSVERLMKQISSFMGDIADEFKIVVVDAIQALCLKYPQKHRVLLNFLANFLREEGGFEFKKTITDAILSLIAKLPECKEAGLLHLCEFIEDCEFTPLSTKILHILGEKGPSTSAPSRYIRFIYNRVILENATVRASAVSALTQFAIRVPSLHSSILTLLSRCMLDDDDEVRDRATIYTSLVKSHRELAKPLLLDVLPVQPLALQRSLEQYQLRPEEGPIVLEKLPIVDISKEIKASEPVDDMENKDLMPENVVPCTPEDHAKELYQIPQFAGLGQLFRSTESIQLTEAETEYVVSCVKHIFPEHLVIQYIIQNTVKDQLLTKLSVEFEMSDSDVWKLESVIELPKLAYHEVGKAYLCFKHQRDSGYPCVSLSNELKFKVHDVDPSTGDADDDGIEEEYPMEEFCVNSSDFVAEVQVPDFRSAWEQLGDEAEVKEQYSLQFTSVVEGVTAVISALGLQPCDNTAISQPDSNVHILLLSGVFVGNIKVLVKSKISLVTGKGLLLQLVVRSEDAEVSQTIADCIR